MPYSLPAFNFDNPEDWKAKGSKVVHEYVTPEANCRAAKTDIDFIVDLIVSECISKDTCAPFIKNYHKFGVQASAWEVIPLIGKGCLMFIAGYNWTRREQLSDAGNNTPGMSARSSLGALFGIFDPEVATSAIHVNAFPPLSSVRRACPDPGAPVLTT